MSMFLCAICDNIRDSDDGCEQCEANFDYGLVCSECMERDAEAPALSLTQA